MIRMPHPRLARRAALALSVALAPLMAAAEDLALVIGASDYPAGVEDGRAVLNAVEALEEAGIEVVAERDPDADELLEAFARFEQMARQGDRLLVVLSGRFLQAGDETWYLPAGTAPEALSELPGEALPMSLVQALLERKPGAAVLAIGYERDGAGARIGTHLRRGPGEIDPAQGVALVKGRPAALAELMEGTLARPGAELRGAIAAERRLAGFGFLPEGWSFLPADDGPSQAELAERRAQEQAQAESDRQASQREADQAARRAAEDAYWRIATQDDDAAAYQAYLERYPQGANADEARQRLRAIREAPERRAEQAEADLNLNREARRAIQRDLQLLDYDTRGIDGIFGPGTRSAIEKWQRENRFEVSSFLNREQIELLQSQAARRNAELEREAEERRARLEAEDRALWADLDQGSSERAVRVYLERFPDGIYADTARERLEAFEAENQRAADAQDADNWRRAVEAGSVEAYQRYVSQNPQGRFVQEAEARIAAIRDNSNADRNRAAQAEQALGLNALTRRLVEERLRATGNNPGRVDGQFDDKTRRALRRYQQEAGIEVSGFLNEQTVVRLLADTVRGILD